MFPRSVPYEHNPPRRDNIITVAMPGITSSRVQLSRYTGPEDGVCVLENWSDGFAPLVREDGDRNRHGRSSALRAAVQAVWRALWRGQSSAEEEASPQSGGCRTAAECLGSAAPSKGGGVCGNGASGPREAGESGGTAQGHDEAEKEGAFAVSPENGAAQATTACAAADTSSNATVISPSGLYYSPLAKPIASLSSPLTFPFPSPIPTPPVRCYAQCRISCRLLHNIIPSPEVAEMVHRRWYLTLNPLHWLLTAKELATCFWFAVRPFQFCYSEVGRTNLAGTTDQLLFTREVQRAVEMVIAYGGAEDSSFSEAGGRLHQGDAAADAVDGRPGESIPTRCLRPHIVLFGCSRGATTCFYASMKLPLSLARYVSLVIVEAPFDTLQHVIEASSYWPSLNLWLFKLFCDYKGPEDERVAYGYNAETVALHCPIAFVMSARDRRVPNECTQALIDGVRERLVPQVIPAVEVLTLQHSRHPCMAVGDKEDQAAYVEFVEGLYDKYCGVESAPPLRDA